MQSYNPYRKYCSAWWRYWTNVPGDIMGYFQRVWDYRILLWEDNDYDFNSVMRLMRFKLKRISKHFEKHNISAHCEDRVAELARLDVMLRNVIEDDPDDEWSMHYSQWDTFTKGFKDCKNQKEHKRALKLTWEREQRNWFGLWKYIAKNARNWWD